MNPKRRQERLDSIQQRLHYRRLRRIVNASLHCAANCNNQPPTDGKCNACMNPACVKAKAELDAFWQEKDRC